MPKKDRWLVVGLPQHYAPINELWAAAVFDGKNFLVVSDRGTDVREKSAAFVEVDLVATRIDPQTGRPLDMGYVPFDGRDPQKYSNQVAEVRKKSPTEIMVAAEKGVFERHPALASSGNGRTVLVYSRHAGLGKFTLRCVLVTE